MMHYAFDLTSDLHLDTWINPNKAPHVQERVMRVLLDNICYRIDPATGKKPAKTLVIAGDLGHYNHQNLRFLKIARERYENVLVVAGNHDFWLFGNTNRKRYTSSWSRYYELKNGIADIPGVHLLDANAVEIDGVVFGGFTSWPDATYAQDCFELSDKAVDSLFASTMNDSKYLDFERCSNVNPYYAHEFSARASACRRDSAVVAGLGVDVVVSHVAPVYSHFDKPDPTSTFYQFDGSAALRTLAALKKDVVWCFGHTHRPYDFKKNNVRFVCSPLGYCGENTAAMHSMWPQAERALFAGVRVKRIELNAKLPEVG